MSIIAAKIKGSWSYSKYDEKKKNPFEIVWRKIYKNVYIWIFKTIFYIIKCELSPLL